MHEYLNVNSQQPEQQQFLLTNLNGIKSKENNQCKNLQQTSTSTTKFTPISTELTAAGAGYDKMDFHTLFDLKKSNNLNNNNNSSTTTNLAKINWWYQPYRPLTIDASSTTVKNEIEEENKLLLPQEKPAVINTESDENYNKNREIDKANRESNIVTQTSNCLGKDNNDDDDPNDDNHKDAATKINRKYAKNYIVFIVRHTKKKKTP